MPSALIVTVYSSLKPASLIVLIIVFVLRFITLTVLPPATPSLLLLTTYANLPLGVIAIPAGELPCVIGIVATILLD
ncbi:MAG: hypothetical protein WDZ41_02615 [Candidatus Babeliales bacterium]